jgi:hypothetical protein
MGIVAYDAAGKVVAQWEKPGARSVLTCQRTGAVTSPPPLTCQHRVSVR